MKVTLKNTQVLYYISIINILICGVIFCSLYTNDKGIFLQLLFLLLSVSSVFILIYFVGVLLFFKEATAVTAAYSMLMGISVINIITMAFPHLLNANYFNWLGTLTLVISLLAAFRSFFVKAEPVKYSFMILGGSIALIVLPRLFILLAPAKIDDLASFITNSGDAGTLIALLASCFVLKRMLNFLKAGGTAPVEVQAEDEI